MLKRMPAESGVVVYLDFAALRRSGILQLLSGSPAAQDPEYREFVRNTEFDYKRDLDAALLAFAPNGKFFLLKGRFDWKSLRTYAKDENGYCYNSLCRMEGSAPDRKISFFPVQSGVMALAVSRDDSAALRLTSTRASAELETPDAPVWLSLSASMLKSGEDMPDSARMFARNIERAETVTLAFLPDGNRLAAKLNVRCRSGQDASELASDLVQTTNLLRGMIASEHQNPGPAGLSGVLTSGSFHAEGRHVLGYWPIERSFVEALLSGGSG
jgi:hypothetical protein